MNRLAPLALVLLATCPASAQSIRATIGLPGPPGRVLVASIDLDGGPTIAIEGCITNRSPALGCYRTRRVLLSAADRAELERHLAAIRSMPRCEPVGFEAGDPPFELVLPGEDRARHGHLPRDASAIPARTDEACEAEHALAAWILTRFQRG